MMISKWYLYSLVIIFICSIVTAQAEAVEKAGKKASGAFGEFEAAGQLPAFDGKSIDQLADQDNAAISFVGAIATFVTAGIVIIGVIAMIVAGYIYMTAAGDATRVSQAKTIVVSALLGIVLALAAYLILRTVSPTLVPMVDPF